MIIEYHHYYMFKTCVYALGEVPKSIASSLEEAVREVRQDYIPYAW